MSVPFPFALRPMLLKQRREPFDGARWLFEPKWDGWRALAMVQDGQTLILSRNGRELTRGFRGVAEALYGLPSGTVLDGELVILDAEGRPDFDALMRREGAPCLLAFDLLRLRDRDLCTEPLEERKRRLTDLVAGPADLALQSTDGIVGEGRALFELVKARGMEGIVAKRFGSPYAPGKRTGAWVKVKVPGYAPDRAEWFDRRRQTSLAPDTHDLSGSAGREPAVRMYMSRWVRTCTSRSLNTLPEGECPRDIDRAED